MVYYLGSDVDLFMTTEHVGFSVENGANVSAAASGTSTAAGIGTASSNGSIIPDRETGLATASRINDVIGIDFTPGTRQEEISYMGKNTNLQAEIKKEIILTVTRKVTDNTFDNLFNTPARDGVFSTDGFEFCELAEKEEPNLKAIPETASDQEKQDWATEAGTERILAMIQKANDKNPDGITLTSENWSSVPVTLRYQITSEILSYQQEVTENFTTG
jgi:hypothetical protein